MMATLPKPIYNRKKKLSADGTESIVMLPQSGVYVLCSRIPAWLFESFERSRMAARPSPPVRMAKAIGGVEEEIEDLEDEGYKEEMAEWQEDYNERLLALVLDHVEPLAESKAQAAEWERRLERYGISDTSENRVRCFAFKDPALDPMAMTNEVMRLTTVTQEEVAKAAERFQSAVDGRTGEGAGGPDAATDVQ